METARLIPNSKKKNTDTFDLISSVTKASKSPYLTKIKTIGLPTVIKRVWIY